MGLDDPAAQPLPYEILQWKTHAVYSDFDASPTKAWMIYNRAKEDVKPLFELAFGKRPYEELYDLKNDPDHMNNEAHSKEYSQIKEGLKTGLWPSLLNITTRG